jgi:hypothetical protein
MPVLILGTFSYTLAAIASLVGFLSFAARRPRLEGDDFVREELTPRLRDPQGYALKHPVETVRRWFR